MSDDVLVARALLSRVAEPASVPVWKVVRRHGPVAALRGIRSGALDGESFPHEAARIATADPLADLEAAERHGIRLVVPESDEWPHFAFAALETAGVRRVEAWDAGDRERSEKGELVPPLALWTRGNLDLATVGVRSVAIVGARAATEYGEWVARHFAAQLAERRFVVVSGGAHGIDAAAHRGALSVRGDTVLVSAGGLDRAYPPGNAALFDRIADDGLLVSESPPGADPKRRRFLTRNRLIAALGTGTLVVEAAARSGAANTARHCTNLGRPLMAVPGPVTSAASVGCHDLITAEYDPARLVTSAEDVALVIGTAADVPVDAAGRRRRRGDELSDALDDLDPPVRQVFDGFPSRGWVGPDSLARAVGLPMLTVIRALPLLEVAGLIEASPQGYRIVRRPKASAPT